MDEQTIRKYVSAGYVIKCLTLLAACIGMGVGTLYLFLYVPLFMEDGYFQISSITALMLLVFLLSTIAIAPLEYRVDKKFGRTTLGFGSYLGYRLRSRLVLLIPFAMLLLVFVLFWLLAPGDEASSSLLAFTVSLLAVLIVSLAMPRLYGSILRKEKIEDQELLNSIKELSAKMGLGGRFAGAYHVPVRGFKVMNAAQLGFSGRQARIYLIGDVDKVLDRGEVEAVVAHEFAHLKLRHIAKLFILLLSLMIGLYSAFTLMTSLLVYFLLGSGAVLTPELTLIIIIMEYAAPLLVLYLLLLKFRRMFEIEADSLAAQITSPKDLATSLSKLADYNLVPRRFPKIIGIVKGHPSISERIERLERMSR